MPFSSEPDTKLSRVPGAALHRQLFIALRDQITRGVYAPGALLPNEDELCLHFGVSKITVRRALSDLAIEGLVERYQGRGTYVSESSASLQRTETANFMEALKQRGGETEVKVLEVKTAVAPRAIALQLQIQAGEPALYCARLRHSGATHLVVTEAWVPADLGRGVTAEALLARPLFELLTAQGVEFGRVLEEITAVATTPSLAKVLRMDIGAPMLRLTRLMYDRADRPVEHLTAYMNPQYSRVLLSLPRNELHRGIASRIVHARPAAT